MKTEIFQLGKDSIVYGAGSVITRFIGLFTLPLFTAYLIPEEYGVLAMLALLNMIVQPVFSLGLTAAMGPSYFEKEDQDNKSKVVWTVFAINLISAFLLVSLSWNFPIFLGELVRLPTNYSYLVSISLTGNALLILASSFMQQAQFEKQSGLYVLITVVTTFSAILVTIYTVIFLELGVEGMIYGQFAGNAITLLIFFFNSLKSTNPRISGRMMNELLRLGLPLIPSFAFLFILMHSNKYFLEWHSGLDAVGIYSIGFNLGMVISIVTGGIVTAWYPFFMSYLNKQQEARVVFGQILSYYFMIIGSLCTAFFIFAKPAVQFLTNEKFYEASTVIGFVALGNFCLTLFNFFLPSLYYEKKVQYLSLIQGFAALLSIPISYILIKQYSILGAALVVFINHFLMATLLFFWNKVFFNTRFLVIYEWGRILLITTLFTVIVLTYYLLIENSYSLFWSVTCWIFCPITIFFVLTRQERISLIIFLRRIY
jgi:O-antigen/teichoic acid export membrane protein